jgi:hypothetical protein
MTRGSTFVTQVDLEAPLSGLQQQSWQTQWWKGLQQVRYTLSYWSQSPPGCLLHLHSVFSKTQLCRNLLNPHCVVCRCLAPASMCTPTG